MHSIRMHFFCMEDHITELSHIRKFSNIIFRISQKSFPPGVLADNLYPTDFTD